MAHEPATPTPKADKLLSLSQALQQAHAHWNAGQANQAEILCRRILDASPGQADASQLLGLIAHAYGQPALALDLLRQACRTDAAPAVYFGNLAEVCRQQGLLAEGEAAARQATKQDPGLVMAWNNLGIILQEAGRDAESVNCLERVAELQPHSPKALNNLGNAYVGVNRLDEARRLYVQALALQSDYAEGHSNLAFVLGELGDYDAAADAAHRAIACNPRLMNAYINLAGIEAARSRPREALQWTEALLTFAPNHPQALELRTRLRTACGAQAAAAETPATSADTASVGAHPAAMTAPAAAQAQDLHDLAHRVRALLTARQHADAERLLRENMDPRGAPAALWRLLGLTVKFQGRVQEAAEIQAMLATAMPGNLSARFDLAETRLLQGDFERGWTEYRWRYSLSHTAAMDRKVQRPRWDGSRIDGQTLLIHDEQGYGDTLQFMRLIDAARTRSGARVVLEVHPDLLSFARRLVGPDAFPRGQIPPPFDQHCELMSLPMAIGLRMADLPGQVGYLSADAARVEKWRKRLAGLPRPWVALAWAGRPTHSNDANRSLALADMVPLAVPGITYLAIQKGPAAAQAATAPAGMNIVPLDAEIADFEDTAAILSLADLLVSVDSSPVHLAGALNRPAWVLLPFLPDWRWLLQRSDSPWYPSLQLFRQPAPGDWKRVMHDVGQALATRFHRGQA
ncbi:tetratricopeptide repeat protein [Achromobacter sp. ACM05]|uniref:tetratricopeptide repeat protein n=1 Tax=Achromobacter sp. ACM05 TaxID=2854776 RepID=UPI001C47D82E|nr:tetratricopeptide repeat protein [Achromobacter sp. ACM05]MBV7499867.1 tetratricopeptide repeat protein [Achromobacter sp. ACM05]